MFSWISSKPSQADAAANGTSPAPLKMFDPLKGGGGAAAFYTSSLNGTSGEHVKVRGIFETGKRTIEAMGVMLRWQCR